MGVKHPKYDTIRAQVKAEKWRSERPWPQPRRPTYTSKPPQIVGGTQNAFEQSKSHCRSACRRALTPGAPRARTVRSAARDPPPHLCHGSDARAANQAESKRWIRRCRLNQRMRLHGRRRGGASAQAARPPEAISQVRFRWLRRHQQEGDVPVSSHARSRTHISHISLLFPPRLSQLASHGNAMRDRAAPR